MQGWSPNPPRRAEPLTLSILLLLSSDSHPIVWCIIGLIVGLCLFVQGFRLLQRRHLILDTPVSKVRSASLGMVELSGLAVGPYTTVAPITARPCYYYRTVAWEWKRCGKSNQWVEVAAECMHVPFFLDDNTGKVLIDPRGAELDLHRDFQEEFCDSFFTTKQEAPGNVRSFLLRHGVSTTNKIKVEESCIKPKNALFLLGTLSENPGLELRAQPVQEIESAGFPEGNTVSFNLERGLGSTLLSSLVVGKFSGDSSFEERFSERILGDSSNHTSVSVVPKHVIHLSPGAAPANAAEMTQQQKIAAALLKAGISSPAAWATAGALPSIAVVNGDSPPAAQSNATGGGTPAAPQPATLPDGFDPHPAVVMMKGKNESTFLISWRSQRDLARSLGWKCTLMIWGGAALSILCLYGLHILTNWF
jgi:E3 Ubiquitin ligase